jgi:hypothetical protein
MRALPPDYRGRGLTGWVDLITLLVILSGAIFMGLLALGLFEIATLGWRTRIIFAFVGLSGMWQWRRQRF